MRGRQRGSRTIAAGVVLSFAVAALMAATGRPGSLGEFLQDEVRGTAGLLFSVGTVVGLGGILVLELLFPVRRDQRIMSPSYVLDAFYMFVQFPIAIAVALTVTEPLNGLLDDHADFLVLDSDDWPIWLVFLVGLMVVDFLGWFSHVVMHKVPWFWRFHMIHHSQAQLNPFTANRTHILDGLISLLVRFLPLYFIAPSITAEASTMWLYGLAITWHIRFQHSNIKWTLGPLRYVFVTPQSHRIHHSTDPAHWNSNYSNVFSLWDRMFGVHIGDTSIYPETGIYDDDFPEPTSYSPVEILSCYGRQVVYPVTRAAKRATQPPTGPVGPGQALPAH